MLPSGNTSLVSWLYDLVIPTTIICILTVSILTYYQKFQRILTFITTCFIPTTKYLTAGQIHEINVSEPDRVHTPNKIFLADTNFHAAEAMRILNDEMNQYDVKIVGMDTEFCPPPPPQPTLGTPCLLQLASKGGFSALFRVNQMSTLTPELITLFENEQIWKVGVGIVHDGDNTERKYGNTFRIRSKFDLRYLAEELNCAARGLKPLAAEILQAPHNRHRGGQKWNAERLSEDQIYYAAKDAYLGVALFFDMFTRYMKVKEGVDEWKNLSPAVKQEKLKKFQEKFRKDLDIEPPWPPIASPRRNFILNFWGNIYTLISGTNYWVEETS